MAPRFIELAAAGGTASPYSEAVVSGDVVYVAGQLAQDDLEWHGRSGTIAPATARSNQRIWRIAFRRTKRPSASSLPSW